MLIDKQGKQPGQGQDKHSDPPQVKMMWVWETRPQQYCQDVSWMNGRNHSMSYVWSPWHAHNVVQIMVLRCAFLSSSMYWWSMSDLASRCIIRTQPMWDLDNNVQVSHWCKGKELPQSWCCFCSFYRVLWYHILYASYHKQAAGGSTSQCSITFVHNLDSILWEDHNKNITISTTSILIHLIADFSWGSTFHVKHTCYCSIYLQFACIFWIGGWEQFNSPTIFFLYEVQLQLPEAQLQMLLATVNYVRLATCLWKK